MFVCYWNQYTDFLMKLCCSFFILSNMWCNFSLYIFRICRNTGYYLYRVIFFWRECIEFYKWIALSIFERLIAINITFSLSIIHLGILFARHLVSCSHIWWCLRIELHLAYKGLLIGWFHGHTRWGDTQIFQAFFSSSVALPTICWKTTQLGETAGYL